MLRVLLKRQLLEINRSFFYNAKTGKGRSRLSSGLLIAAYVLLMAGLLGGMFTILSLSLCAPLAAAGAGWLYFAILSLIALALGVFGSVFNTYAGLYLARDNDLLLSLPIPVRDILAARLLGVYLMGLMFSGVVMLPAVIVYWVILRPGPTGVIGSLLLAVLLSLLVLVRACLLGWVVAKVSVKLKGRSFVTVLAALVFFGLYYFIYFRASIVIRTITANAAALGGAVKGAAWPLYALGRVGEGSLPAMLGVSAVVLALLVLTGRLLSRSFLSLATAGGRTERIRGRTKPIRAKSPSAALLGKELARFTSSAGYMLNCGFGALMTVAAAVVLLIKGGALRDILAENFGSVHGFPAVLLTAGVCLLAGSSDISAPSVSLEGKHLWLAQSLPVAPRQVLWAKLKLHLLIACPPALLCSLCGAAVLGTNAGETVFLILLPQLTALLIAALGLAINLKRPNLTWTNETAPVKQSLGVLVTLLAGWLWGALMGIGHYLLMGAVSAPVWLALCSLVTAALAGLLLLWLRGRGARIFSAL